jgi:hypothetical protein
MVSQTFHAVGGLAGLAAPWPIAALDFAQRVYLVAGLVGMALPILIHLLTRDRIRRVAFSTVRFFVKANRRILRRRKLQEMILLAMRAIACGLLGVAFAQPFLKAATVEGPQGAPPRTLRAIVVDVSASMTPAVRDGTLKKAAAEALDELTEGADAVALVTFADSPTVEVAPTPGAPGFDEVRSRLAGLSPGHGGTDIAEALRVAQNLVRGAPAAGREVVLLSDLQRSGWRPAPGRWSWDPNVKLQVRAVSPAGKPWSVAVEAVEFPRSMVMDKTARTISARIRNSCDEPRPGVPIRLIVNGKEVSRQTVNLRPQKAENVSFRHAFDAEGDNRGLIVVDLNDADPVDNVFYFNARVIPRMKVVVVAGSPEAAAFVALALSPAPESPFETVTVEAARAGAKDLDGALAVILADVGDAGEDLVKGLTQVLARGSGILFLPGDRTKAETFNRAFAALAPCQLRSAAAAAPAAAGGAEGGLVLAQVEYAHPVFEVFQHPHSGDLSLPKFRKLWEVTDTQHAVVLARFSNGRPAILERQIGQGVSMMLVCPVGLGWNDLPDRAVFLPYLHQTTRYLAIRSEKPTGYIVGDRLSVPAGARWKEAPYPIAQAGEVTAMQPGFYTCQDKDGTFTFAVNRKSQESDPARVLPEEILGSLPKPAEAAQADEASSAPGPRDGAAERDAGAGWWYVLAGVTMLLMGELFLGNRTLRH